MSVHGTAWYNGVMPSASLAFGLRGHLVGKIPRPAAEPLQARRQKPHHLASQQHHLPERAFVYPLVICYIAIEHGPVEIVDFPIKNGDVPWQNVSSPEGKYGDTNLGCQGLLHSLGGLSFKLSCLKHGNFLARC